MKKLAASLCAATLAGCASNSTPPAAPTGIEPAAAVMRAVPGSGAGTVNAYKLELAQRIAAVNSDKMFRGRPQALLRSVIVVKYVVDRNGHLLRSEIMRSNHDAATEATALASLRHAAPFPKPATGLLQHGRLELTETWLFNTDGRFQLRTIAEPQMDR